MNDIIPALNYVLPHLEDAESVRWKMFAREWKMFAREKSYVNAIKALRELHNYGLKMAKDIVNNYVNVYESGMMAAKSTEPFYTRSFGDCSIEITMDDQTQTFSAKKIHILGSGFYMKDIFDLIADIADSHAEKS